MLIGSNPRTLDPRTEIRNLTGIGHKLAARVIEDLGDGDPYIALESIVRNPYALIDVDGIAFKKADTIASRDFDLSNDDPRRHYAGNRWILEQRGVLTARDYQTERNKLGLNDREHQDSGAEIEEGLYWLPEELDAERQLERWMRALELTPGELPELTPVQAGICERMGLDEVQTHAVRMALHTSVLCLTGGAGCGKTHVVAALAQCLLATSRTVRGMAFAGKAADRMREAFDSYGVLAESSTIHKALGFQKGGFTVDLLGEDLVVIDESSMLNGWLLWQVIKRLRKDAILVLVGDENQLPPIGYGTPFVDLLKYGCPRAHLSRNYRQADQQGILHMAEGVLHRQRPAPASCVEMHLGIDQADLDEVFDGLIQVHGGTDFEGWQVITYTNEIAERYNLRAQAQVNPDGLALFEYPLWKLGTKPGTNRPAQLAEIRIGDKVIVVKNSSTLEIFNGQTGRVIGQVYKAKVVQRKNSVTGRWEEQQGEQMQHLRIEITGRMVDIPQDEVEKYVQLGYVITVHKAQGSDWPRVIIMQPGKVREDTARRFFYTAITRAKTHLCIVSLQKAVAWWTNAAADAPDEPSTLMRRLARPAVPAGYIEVFGQEADDLIDAAEIDWDAYRPEPGLEFQPVIDALGLTTPLLSSEWDEVKGEVQRVAPWRTLRQKPTDHAAQGPDLAAQDALLDRIGEIKAAFRQLSIAGVA